MILNSRTTIIKKEAIKQVRIIPQSSCYVLEVVYEKKAQERDLNNDRFIALDLGVNNLATISNSFNDKPIIINGKPIKSINQYYNKKKAHIQSQLKKNHGKYSSKRLIQLTQKRNLKIQDYIHNCSKYIIDYCIKNRVRNVVIGHNKEWKQEVKLGKRNNQNFVQIPFNTLIHQIQYKAELNDIEVQIHEESYTSKCDALAVEDLKKHENYLGKRTHRGLFKSSVGVNLNADINGSLIILRKVIGDGFISELDRGCVVQPVKVNPLQTSA